MSDSAPRPASSSSSGWGRRIIIILILIFIAIQFFQAPKNNNDYEISNDISTVVAVPEPVQKILIRACYDCHSNNTEYPWYSNIQPVAWWLNDHIEEGKKHLNFNEFASILPRNGKNTQQRQLKKLEEIQEMIEEGEMPLKSYKLMHKEARLNESQKKLIFDWVAASKAKFGLSAIK